MKKLWEKLDDEYCDDWVLDTVYRDEQDDEGRYRKQRSVRDRSAWCEGDAVSHRGAKIVYKRKMWRKLREKLEDEYCDDWVLDTVYCDEQDNEGRYRNREE